MHAVDNVSGLRLILMMRRYGAGVLLLIQRGIVQSRNACWRPILPAACTEKPYPGLLSEESAKLAL